jgi:RimJ/RimL family protein N-acetyltransferase
MTGKFMLPALETGRLTLRPFVLGDARFVLGLLNEPSFLLHIGDKGVRTEDEARRYIADGPLASYARSGYGLYVVELREGRSPIGICGLLKRDWLEDVDLGFALLPPYWGHGYAFEAAAAVLAQGRGQFGLRRIVAITSLENEPSIRLLGKLGFRFERVARFTQGGEELRLFAVET